MSDTKEIKVCRHCGFQYPATRVRGCKCDGEQCSLVMVWPAMGASVDDIHQKAKELVRYDVINDECEECDE